MGSVNGEEVYGRDELLHAQAHIWNHMFGFINSMSLKFAIELGIPDIINKHGQPMTLNKLIDALPIHPSKSHSITRLMRILVHSGFFETRKVDPNDPEEGYVLNASSWLLLKDNPLSATPFILTNLDPIVMKPLHHLSAWSKDDNLTPSETASGVNVWEFCKDPKKQKMLNDAMSSDSELVVKIVSDTCKGVFEGLHSLVDIGGGTGTMTKGIAGAFPWLECTVFDLPHVVADLQGSKNLKYIGGDMFDTIPPADAYLLKWILHDWSDEECVKILKKCKEAITQSKTQKGKVIVIEIIVGNQPEDKKIYETQLYFDMLMMIATTGRERTEEEWAKLFFDAGFSRYNITPLLGARSIIEIFA